MPGEGALGHLLVEHPNHTRLGKQVEDAPKVSGHQALMKVRPCRWTGRRVVPAFRYLPRRIGQPLHLTGLLDEEVNQHDGPCGDMEHYHA